MTGLIERTLCRLEGQLPGRVSRAGDKRYVAATALWGKPIGRMPRAVVHCRTPQDVQLAILGSGRQKYQQLIRDLAKRFPGKVAPKIAFDIRLSHLIQAGSDILLIPSHYEPCGLNQLYAMKYGTVPIGRKTGGLADTIMPATGFLFEEPQGDALLGAIKEALRLYGKAKSWKRLMLAGMSKDWSWNRSAAEYIKYYEMAIQKQRSQPA